jgi:hypothetical protein
MSYRTWPNIIQTIIKSNGLEDVTQSFIIQKMMRGMFRLDKRHDCRKPITLKILIKLTEALNKVCFSVYESVLSNWSVFENGIVT